MMKSLPVVALLTGSSLLVTAQITSSAALSHCPCGYIDDAGRVWTDSIIAYYNESTALDVNVWEKLDFTHKKEKGWTVIYREAATSSNVNVGNEKSLEWQTEDDGFATSLQLTVDPATSDHVVTGAALKSLREDIQYGTFRASMRSPPPYAGGSVRINHSPWYIMAFAMGLHYNSSEQIKIDMLNRNSPENARILPLLNGEAPDWDYSAKYSDLQEGYDGVSALHPWSFMDVRFDWTKDSVDYWVGGHHLRSVSADDKKESIPYAPQALSFRHWSTGDKSYMMGPPSVISTADVRWIRAFFNTSLMTTAGHAQWDQKCNAAQACSISNETLRGYTRYSPAATVRWTPPTSSSGFKIVAAIVAGVFSFIGVIPLCNAFLRRSPWQKLAPSRKSSEGRGSMGSFPEMPEENNESQNREHSLLTASVHSAGRNVYSFHEQGLNQRPNLITRLPSYQTVDEGRGHIGARDDYSYAPDTEDEDDEKGMMSDDEDVAPDASARRPGSASSASSRKGLGWGRPEQGNRSTAGTPVQNFEPAATSSWQAPGVKGTTAAISASSPFGLDISNTEGDKLRYLAGFSAVACLGITLRHFALTFWPSITDGSGNTKHFGADSGLYYAISPWLLTQLWMGPFFVVSCRFIAAKYLKQGQLDDIAQTMLLRGVRLLFPCAILMLMEYFFFSVGVQAALEWLPSISWSTWPYLTPQQNFGVFINEYVELAYMIPNGLPEVTTHYAASVLWAIPVQHFYSYVTLLAAVMIRDIKSPGKRLGFFAVAIGLNWYARSWGACHWVGVLLSDLDISFEWVEWAQAKWFRLYPLITGFALISLCAPMIMLSSDLAATGHYDFLAVENGIHPDIYTGQPLSEVKGQTTPEFYIPTLAILLCSFTLQACVELSTWLQWILSIGLLERLQKHIMSLYLLHGLVFWSLGAWVATSLGSHGVPYWANLLITFIVSYVVLGLICMLLTPLIDMSTHTIMRQMLKWATQTPVPRRDTLAPFSKELVINRGENASEPKNAP